MPEVKIATSERQARDQLRVMLTSSNLQETPPHEMSWMVRIGIEARGVAMEKMLEYYERICIEVTPQMSLAPEKPWRSRRKVG